MLFYAAELLSLGSVSQGSATNGAWRVGETNSRREPSQVRFWGGRPHPAPVPVWGRWEGQDLGSVISRNTEPFSVTNIRFQLPHPSLSLKNQEMGARHCLHSLRARSGSSHSTEPNLDWSEQWFLEVRDDGSARSGLLTKNRANQREGKGHTESTGGAFVLARGVALCGMSLHDSPGLPVPPLCITLTMRDKNCTKCFGRSCGTYLTLPEFGKG